MKRAHNRLSLGHEMGMGRSLKGVMMMKCVNCCNNLKKFENSEKENGIN